MLSKSFCSSPWYHLRLTYDGSFEKCRWSKADGTSNIKKESLLKFYDGEAMSKFREDFLSGKSPKECEACYYQEQFGKLSGRQKQLLKSAITVDDFENSLLSSPHFEEFCYSHLNNGAVARDPSDLQIDLGNLCNSACIMCVPQASSRLTQDYIKLSRTSTLFAEPVPFKNWVDDQASFGSFLLDLDTIAANLKYLHLLGGETLYNQAFYKICDKLISSKQSSTIILGTTTNGTIYNTELETIIPKFKEFHLGISIESVTPLNDYIRYPSSVDTILENISRFIKLRETCPGLYLTLRITPNLFSIYDIDQLFEYLIENKITAESCNILYKPECLRMELMPDDIRAEVIDKLQALASKYSLVKSNVANIRNPHLIDQVTGDTVLEYLDFVKNYQQPSNKDELHQQLVEFLKSFESLRNNSILDYAPRYTEFLRRIGY